MPQSIPLWIPGREILVCSGSRHDLSYARTSMAWSPGLLPVHVQEPYIIAVVLVCVSAVRTKPKMSSARASESSNFDQRPCLAWPARWWRPDRCESHLLRKMPTKWQIALQPRMWLGMLRPYHKADVISAGFEQTVSGIQQVGSAYKPRMRHWTRHQLCRSPTVNILPSIIPRLAHHLLYL